MVWTTILGLTTHARRLKQSGANGLKRDGDACGLLIQSLKRHKSMENHRFGFIFVHVSKWVAEGLDRNCFKI
jgi:hypothetical protein